MGIALSILQLRDLRRRKERHPPPILFSQLRRRDGEGTVNPEELFADDRPFRSEGEREREDELRALMSSIIDWANRF